MPEDGIFAVERGQIDVVREAVADGGPTLPEPTGPVRVGVTISAPEGQAALYYEAEAITVRGKAPSRTAFFFEAPVVTVTATANDATKLIT